MIEKTMTHEWLVKTQNEWMRRYIEEPEKFEREFRTILEFSTQEASGKEPDYGERCTAYMFQLMDELQAVTAAPTIAP